MNRQEKERTVKELKSAFESAEGAFAVNYRGLAVDSLTELRKKLRGEHGALRIAKLTLLRRALEGDAARGDLISVLQDQVAIVFSGGEAPATAKVLCEFSKSTGKLEVLGGLYKGSLLAKNDVERFASLPSHDVLLAQVLWLMNSPARKLAFVINVSIKRLLIVLQRVAAQKKEA